MRALFGDYLRNLFQIKFGEEKSMSASDFERSLKNYFYRAKRKPRGRYNWGEINNDSTKDFKKSLRNYLK